MRDVNRLERAIILLALYVWQWLEALQDYAQVVSENKRGLTRGAADRDWQRTLHQLAEPVKVARLKRETGEQPLVVLATWEEQGGNTIVMAPPARPLLAVVTETGLVVDTIPTPAEHIRKHRSYDVPKRARASAATKRKALAVSEVRAAERRVRKQLDTVVMEAMRGLGLTLAEARAIMGAHHYESVFDRMATA